MRLATLALVLCSAALGCGDSPNASDGGGGCAEGGTCGRSDLAVAAHPDLETPIVCGTDGWATYGHDARRTFATDACVTGPLTLAWRYDPAPPMGRTVNGVHHAIATSDGVFLQWAASDGQYVGTTAADRLTTDGKRSWTFDSGSDANEANWASIALGKLVLNDDGVYFLDLTTGMKTATTGVDWWGQTLPSASTLFLVTTSKSDGPGLFVAAMDATAKTSWKQNVQGTMCMEGLSDSIGAIALDGTTLFYAAVYHAGKTMPLFASGLYAFDSASGMQKWTIPSTPASAISAGAGLVFLIEGSTLTARHQSDGSIAWSVPKLTGVGAQAPVLAAGLAIVATASTVAAFDAATGKPAWMTPIAGANAEAYQLQINNGCAGLQVNGGPVATSLAAALGSSTLVVTAQDGVHILALATGVDQWHGKVSGAVNTVHDPIAVGHTLYVVDSPPSSVGYGPGGLIALTGM